MAKRPEEFFCPPEAYYKKAGPVGRAQPTPQQPRLGPQSFNCRESRGPSRAIRHESRKKFEAVRWNYSQTVAWICYRDPSRLDDLSHGIAGRDKWYGSQEYQADQQVRRAIERERIKAFDAGGNEIKPLADLGCDPKLFFQSAAVKAWWPCDESRLTSRSESLQELKGTELDREIADALQTAVDKRKRENSNAPLNGKQQTGGAMKILRERGIKAKRGGLRKRVEEIADADFAKYRGPVGVRRTGRKA